jgi:hypothetical protein
MTAAVALRDHRLHLVEIPPLSPADVREQLGVLVGRIATAHRPLDKTEQALPARDLAVLRALLLEDDAEALRRLDQLVATAVDHGARAAREEA